MKASIMGLHDYFEGVPCLGNQFEPKTRICQSKLVSDHGLDLDPTGAYYLESCGEIGR
jgi:hypothetical protein